MKSLPEGENGPPHRAASCTEHHLRLLAGTCPDAGAQMGSQHEHQALRALHVRPRPVICRSGWKEEHERCARVRQKPGGKAAVGSPQRQSDETGLNR